MGLTGPTLALAIHAKRNGGQAIENKRSREMPHFAPSMISMAYDPGAKPFVSLREIKPVVFAGFPFRRGPKRSEREIDGGVGARAADTTRKWRHKPLESLKMDSKMAGGPPFPAGV